LRHVTDGCASGRVVGPGTGGVAAPLVQLEQNTRLRLVVAVPEAHVAGIARGASVSFTVPAYPGETFSATIARSAQSLDPRTRTMTVELDAVNANGRLSTGMFADVVWPVRRGRPARACHGGRPRPADVRHPLAPARVGSTCVRQRGRRHGGGVRRSARRRRWSGRGNDGSQVGTPPVPAAAGSAERRFVALISS
jgi:hypothetical protein